MPSPGRAARSAGAGTPGKTPGRTPGKSRPPDRRKLVSSLEESVLTVRKVLASCRSPYGWLLASVPVGADDSPDTPVAWTNGRSIMVGPRFLDMSPHRPIRGAAGTAMPGEREFVVVHELMHIVRGHPGRLSRMRSRHGMPFRPMLANRIADSIINEDIEGWRNAGLPMPKSAQRWRELQTGLAEMAKRAGFPLPPEIKGDAGAATMEAVHDAACMILEAHERSLGDRPCGCCGGTSSDQDQPPEEGQPEDGQQSQQSQQSQQGERSQDRQGGQDSQGAGQDASGRGPGKDRPDGNGQGQEAGGQEGSQEAPQSGQGRLQGPANPAQAGGCAPADLRREWLRDGRHPEGDAPMRGDVSDSPPGDDSDEEIERQERAWRNAMRRAVSQTPGSAPGAALAQWLEADADVSMWRRTLRPLLERFLAPRPSEEPSRPSRGFIVQQTFGMQPFWEPALRTSTPGGTLCLCIDTSGSIDDDTLQDFLSRTFAVARSFGCPTHILMGDTQIQFEAEGVDQDIEGLRRSLQRFRAGRGGTEFAPMIDRAVELEADVVLYLTDGYAEFPERPKDTEVVWAVTGDGRDASGFPWGMVLPVEPRRS